MQQSSAKIKINKKVPGTHTIRECLAFLIDSPFGGGVSRIRWVHSRVGGATQGFDYLILKFIFFTQFKCEWKKLLLVGLSEVIKLLQELVNTQNEMDKDIADEGSDILTSEQPSKLERSSSCRNHLILCS